MNSAVNCGSRSERAVSRRPCNFQMLSLNKVARPQAVTVECVGIIWACFVWWQHVTNSTSYPWASGKPVMKSVVMSFQGAMVDSLGLSFPAGFSGKDFIHWHLSQPDT